MWHVGHLYRIGDLLELLDQRPCTRSALLFEFPNYRGVDTGQLVDLSITGGWIQTDNQNNLIITPQGRGLLIMDGPVLRLRSQVRTLMKILKPAWAAATGQGRKALAQYAPLEAVQCLREAGMLDSLDEDVITWWDGVAAQYRTEGQIQNVETGRKGERLSYSYERNRTGKRPHWIALEYEGVGYDIISQLSEEIATPLLIEVKTSTEKWEYARFYFTRNEWDVLTAERHAVLHLWSIGRNERVLSIVPVSAVSSHIPRDQGSGKWRIIECPFAAFESERFEMTHVENQVTREE